MRIWILDRACADWEATQLVAGLRAAGIDATFVDWESVAIGTDGVAVEGRTADPPTAAFVRSPVVTRARCEELAVEFDRLRLLERAGVRLINSAAAIEATASKLRQALLLAAASIPVPTTRVVRSVDEIRRAMAEWGAVVVKPVYGHAGVSVFALGRLQPGVVTEREQIHVWHLLRQHTQLVVQRRVGREPAYVRVCLVGDRVVSQYRLRIDGGGGVPHELGGLTRESLAEDPRFSDLALDAAKVLGVELTAVDLVEGGDGVEVIEVNPCLSTWESVEGTYLDLTDRGITNEHVALANSIGGAHDRGHR